MNLGVSVLGLAVRETSDLVLVFPLRTDTYHLPITPWEIAYIHF